MEERTVSLPDGKIEYLVHGQGPVLLFLHGGFATPRAYIPLIELIGKTHTVIAPTHPGHGNSFAVDKSWTVHRIAQTYQDFFRITNTVPRTIVGHSMGGAIGLLVANDIPVKQLVMLDAPGIPFVIHDAEAREKRWLEMKLIVRYLHNRQHAKRTLSAVGAVMFTSYKHHENISWLFEHVPQLDIRAEAKRLRTPTAMFWGSIDGVVPPDVGHAMHKLIEGSSLEVFEEKGHEYPIVEPEFTFEHIKKLL